MHNLVFRSSESSILEDFKLLLLRTIYGLKYKKGYIWSFLYNHHFAKLHFIIIDCYKLKQVIIYFLQKSYIFSPPPCVGTRMSIPLLYYIAIMLVEGSLPFPSLGE